MSLFGSLTRKQCLLFMALGLTNLFANMVYTIQAPIFPKEAQERNASATEYGLVFSSFPLVNIILSPIIGSFAPRFGMLRVFLTGIFTSGFATISFGFLVFIKGRYLFIALALLMRIIDGVGMSITWVSIYSLLTMEFQDTLATALGAMESFVGIGLILGPFLGSTLYHFGGLLLPFNVLGGFLLVTGGFVFVVMRCKNRDETDDREKIESESEIGFQTQFLMLKQVPSILYYMSNVIAISINMGFIESLLQVHLNQFHLTSISVGLVFLVYALSNALIVPLSSYICSRLIIPELVPLVGFILAIVGLSQIGPAPFLPMNPSLPLTIVGIVLVGCAAACVLTTGFYLSVCAARESGFKNESTTSSQISGLWLSSISLGFFIGPLLGGVLFDKFGFPWASLSLIGINAVQVISLLTFIIYKWVNRAKFEEERSPLLNNENRESIGNE